MGIIKNFKNKKIVKQINSLNNNMLKLTFKTKGVYKGSINLNFDEIKLPKNITSKIHLYSDDGTLQIFILNTDGEKIAVLTCLQTKKMLEEKEKVWQQEKAEEQEKKDKNEEREQEKKELKKRYEEKIKNARNNRYNHYIKFLRANGASEEILNLQAIQQLIMDIISRADIRVLFESSPILYSKPKSDGTFKIAGKIHGSVADETYEMNICNDGDESHFIKLTRNQKTQVHYLMDDPIGNPDGYEMTDTETIYISRAGEIVKDKHRTR